MQTVPWQEHTGHVNTGPSKWWSWGLAIFLAIMVFFSLISVALTTIVPYGELMSDWEVEEPGAYPEDGASEEQDDWNSSKEDWDTYVATSKLMDDMEELKPFHIWTGLISSVIAIVAIFMLFQLNPNAYKVVYGWFVITTVSGLWYAFKTQEMMNEFYSSFPEFEDSFWMSIQSGSQIGGTLVCNVFLLLIVIMCSMKSQDKGEVEESGFHRQPVVTLQTNQEEEDSQH